MYKSTKSAMIGSIVSSVNTKTPYQHFNLRAQESNMKAMYMYIYRC